MQKSYDFLFEEFSPEKLKERFIFIAQKAESWINHCFYQLGLKNPENYFTINHDLIGEIIIDYFSDIYRMKKFHPIQKVNAIKVASYTAYWVARKKPIQINTNQFSDDIVKKSWLIYVNESFAIMLLCAMAFDQTKSPVVMDLEKFNTFTDSLQYHLIYRIYTQQTLELTLMALQSEYPYPMINHSNY